MQIKTRVFFKNLGNSVLGILVESLAVLFLIAAGFLVCLLWWSFIR